MGLYDALKDVASLAQKADNIDLYRQLLDLSAQALDLQAEVARLKEENAELRRRKDLSARIIRHREPYISLADDEVKLCYCAHCWDTAEQLVQLQCNDYNATFVCPHCHMQGVYDNEKNSRVTLAQEEAINRICEEANRPQDSFF